MYFGRINDKMSTAQNCQCLHGKNMATGKKTCLQSAVCFNLRVRTGCQIFHAVSFAGSIGLGALTSASDFDAQLIAHSTCRDVAAD